MRLFLLSLIGLVPALAAAQSPVVLSLRTPSPVHADVYVTRTIDLRADTTSVGEARVGLLNRRRLVVLEGGAAAAVETYLHAALPEAEGRTPVVAGIAGLLVSEQMTAMTEFGRAEVHLRFFEERADGLVEVGEAAAFVEGRGVDVTSGHDDRLADALDEAIAQFLGAERPDAAGVAAVPEAEIAARTDAGTIGPASLTDQAARSLRTVLTAGPVVGVNAVGGRLGYGIRRLGTGAWEFPLGFHASILRTENPEAGLEGTFASYGGSIEVARRLGSSQAYLQPGLQLAGGSEQINDDSGLFFGGRLGIDLVYYPADKGIVAGVGVYGSRLFGSDLYPRDAGVSGVLGVQF